MKNEKNELDKAESRFLDNLSVTESEFDRIRFRAGEINTNISNNRQTLQEQINSYQRHRTIFTIFLILQIFVDLYFFTKSYSGIDERVKSLESSFYGHLSEENTLVFFCIVKGSNFNFSKFSAFLLYPCLLYSRVCQHGKDECQDHRLF